MESAHATSPWLPPGGSCHDEISASRNRYFVVTDEGWRWPKVSDFHVGWRKPGHIPSIQLHSLTNLPPPLISLATLSSFPPGGSQGGFAARVARLATPTELKKFLAYSNQRTTPPQSDLSVPKCRQIRQLFNHGMIAPGNHNFERFAALCNTPEVEPRALRAGVCHSPNRSVPSPCGRLIAAPTISRNTEKGTTFNGL